jgi:hypothetical protein
VPSGQRNTGSTRWAQSNPLRKELGTAPAGFVEKIGDTPAAAKQAYEKLFQSRLVASDPGGWNFAQGLAHHFFR